jgi:hypothetical protein
MCNEHVPVAFAIVPRARGRTADEEPLLSLVLSVFRRLQLLASCRDSLEKPFKERTRKGSTSGGFCHRNLNGGVRDALSGDSILTLLFECTIEQTTCESLWIVNSCSCAFRAASNLTAYDPLLRLQSKLIILPLKCTRAGLRNDEDSLRRHMFVLHLA